jgi:hypothetical protein
MNSLNKLLLCIAHFQIYYRLMRTAHLLILTVDLQIYYQPIHTDILLIFTAHYSHNSEHRNTGQIVLLLLQNPIFTYQIL